MVALLVFVHLNSERTLEPVRHDGSFAEKQESYPALLVVVRLESIWRGLPALAFGAKAVVRHQDHSYATTSEASGRPHPDAGEASFRCCITSLELHLARDRGCQHVLATRAAAVGRFGAFSRAGVHVVHAVGEGVDRPVNEGEQVTLAVVPLPEIEGDADGCEQR